MITFEFTDVYGWEHAIRGMRNSYNSWDKSDSEFGYLDTKIGYNDLTRMEGLAGDGPSHSKYRRMIVVYTDITAPLYWWKQFDTYKVGTVSNSCSTMHTIMKREFTVDDFSNEHLDSKAVYALINTVYILNSYRNDYINAEPADEKAIWNNVIQLLPSSYNQKRTVMMNYEVLSHIYYDRKDHKLSEWHNFCDWVKGLPYARKIILKGDE